MDNDAGDDGIVAATTFRNAANETGEFEGRLGPNCWGIQGEAVGVPR